MNRGYNDAGRGDAGFESLRLSDGSRLWIRDSVVRVGVLERQDRVDTWDEL